MNAATPAAVAVSMTEQWYMHTLLHGTPVPEPRHQAAWAHCTSCRCEPVSSLLLHPAYGLDRRQVCQSMVRQLDMDNL